FVAFQEIEDRPEPRAIAGDADQEVLQRALVARRLGPRDRDEDGLEVEIVAGGRWSARRRGVGPSVAGGRTEEGIGKSRFREPRSRPVAPARQAVEGRGRGASREEEQETDDRRGDAAEQELLHGWVPRDQAPAQ